MATLYKQPKSPNWFAQYFNAEGRRVSKTTGTPEKREARRIAATYEAAEQEKRSGQKHLPRAFSAVIEAAAREAASGELTLARAEDLIVKLHRLANPEFRIVSLAEHLAAWVDGQRAHVSEKSIKVYEDMKRRIVAALGPKVANGPVGDLTQEHVTNAITEITKQKIKGTTRTLTAATANLDLRALRRALKSAVDRGLARSNAAEGVRPLPTDDSTERAPFTVQEVRKMLDHGDTSDEWHGLILLAAHTGLRLGDVVKLGCDHVEGTRLVLRPEKTKRTRKAISVPLSPPALAWIGARKGSFFPTLKGTKTGTLSTQFRRIMDKAGVPREVKLDGDAKARRSFHSLRHSFTSWLADNDVHSDVRQQLTGHASAGVHARYTHHDEALERAIEKLPAL